MRVHDIDTVTRDMIRMLVMASRTGDMQCLNSLGVPIDAAPSIAGLSPLEIEELVSKFPIRINIDSLLHRIQGCRREHTISQLMAAGCSNRVLRRVFGLSPRDLSHLRARHGAPQPGRPRRLTEAEEASLHDHLQDSPAPTGTPSDKALWCLEAHRRLRLPFMAIYSFIDE